MRAPRSNGAAFVRVTILLAASALAGVACTDGTTPDCSDAQCQVLVEEAAAGDAGAEAATGDDGGADAASADGPGADAPSGADASADSGVGADVGAFPDASDGASE
jgi:hypothetical protein